MMVVSKFLELNDLDAHVEKIRAVYKHRCDVMIEAMEKYFPPEARFTYPDGGLFTWVELPDYVNTRELAANALEEKLAFVPGSGFFPNGGNNCCMRLNYSCMPDEKIEEGIKRLAKVIKDALR